MIQNSTQPSTTARISPRVSLAIWTVPALLSALETVMFARQGGRPISPWRAFVSEAPQWYGWALMTPAIIALGERYPLRRPLRVRSVATHVAASLAASGIIATAEAVLNLWIRPGTRTLLSSINGWFVGNLPVTILAYFAVLGVSYALSSSARLRERERQAAALEAELKSAQLAALRMQLQPHFLFNSLNAIMALVRDRRTDQAIHALSLLSDVLRTTTSAAGDHETTLVQELEFVARYLEIERVRFGDRLRVTIDVPDALRLVRVPTFILQPFVENALKHGVLRERGGNEIAIRAHRQGDKLQLVVRDDGRGVSAGEPMVEGVGIGNARSRLDRLYGAAAALTIGNVADGGPGVMVQITMPLVT